MCRASTILGIGRLRVLHDFMVKLLFLSDIGTLHKAVWVHQQPKRMAYGCTVRGSIAPGVARVFRPCPNVPMRDTCFLIRRRRRVNESLMARLLNIHATITEAGATFTYTPMSLIETVRGLEHGSRC